MSDLADVSDSFVVPLWELHAGFLLNVPHVYVVPLVNRHPSRAKLDILDEDLEQLQVRREALLIREVVSLIPESQPIVLEASPDPLLLDRVSEIEDACVDDMVFRVRTDLVYLLRVFVVEVNLVCEVVQNHDLLGLLNELHISDALTMMVAIDELLALPEPSQAQSASSNDVRSELVKLV